jgi:hypothetical protein
MSNVSNAELMATLCQEKEVYLNAANITAFLYDNGRVEVNYKGLERFLYDNLTDFARHRLERTPAPYLHSRYIGERDDNDGIAFFEEYDKNTPIDEDEDGSCVYSCFERPDNMGDLSSYPLQPFMIISEERQPLCIVAALNLMFAEQLTIADEIHEIFDQAPGSLTARELIEYERKHEHEGKTYVQHCHDVTQAQRVVDFV